MTSPTDRAGREPSSEPGTKANTEAGITAEIEPDEKDWTWVLQRPWPECGFDVGTVAGRQVAARLRTGRRSNGSVFTIETLGQYILHDVAHHLHDVRG
ncbi:MAG: hypothetical protein ACYDC9_05635 [Dermatophilaceae bacterium]